MRVIVSLDCSECKRKKLFNNEEQDKNSGQARVQKYCKFCRKHTAHREGK